MNTKTLGLTTLMILLLSIRATAENSNSPESSWTDLTADQPSRQGLFQHIIDLSREEEKMHPTPTPAKAFNIPHDFFFPADAIDDKVKNEPRKNVIFGIDVSHFTKRSIDLTGLRAQNVEFVYAKATQGVGFKDPSFDYFWNALAGLPAEQKLLRGAYHFLSANIDGKLQAERFVQYVNLHGGFKNGDMPPCVDLEWDVTPTNPDQWKGQSHEQILKNVLAWLKETKKLTGRTPLVYTARSWWVERGIPESDFSLLKDYTVWIADYSKSNKATETPAIVNKRIQSIWQFADNAKLSHGYSGTLDANIFYGSKEAFNKTFDIEK